MPHPAPRFQGEYELAAPATRTDVHGGAQRSAAIIAAGFGRSDADRPLIATYLPDGVRDGLWRAGVISLRDDAYLNPAQIGAALRFDANDVDLVLGAVASVGL